MLVFSRACLYLDGLKDWTLLGNQWKETGFCVYIVSVCSERVAVSKSRVIPGGITVVFYLCSYKTVKAFQPLQDIRLGKWEGSEEDCREVG